MIKDTKKWLIIIALLFLFFVILSILIFVKKTGTVAVIEQDGKAIYEIDLSTVIEPYEIVLDNQYGKNIIYVQPGQISMKDADCPDRVCVDTGVISSAGLPIVCLPHKLSIVIKQSGAKDGFDAVVQ